MTRREELLVLARANPEALVDYVLALEERVRQLEATVPRLEARIQDLEGQLAKNSRNSGKPPGSDGLAKPSPQNLRPQTARRPGGQPGHVGRTLQPVKKPDRVVTHRLERCPCGQCRGGSLRAEPVQDWGRHQAESRAHRPALVPPRRESNPTFSAGDVVEWNGRRCTVLGEPALRPGRGKNRQAHHGVPWKVRHRAIKRVGRELSVETGQPRGNARLGPTYSDCARVYRALRVEPAFQARFGTIRDSAYRSDGKRFTFPREVSRVANYLREHGSSGWSATSAQVIQAATAVLRPQPSDLS